MSKRFISDRSFIKATPFFAAFFAIFTVETVQAEDSLSDALSNGKVLVNARLRYETVDQDGFTEDAHAVTARVRLGYETAPYKGLSFLGQLDKTEHIGAEKFDSKENGRTNFPAIADPDSFRVNQAYLTYKGIADTIVNAGRQRIILGNSRFLGQAGWRQNEQTFDAVRVSTTTIQDTEIQYGYVFRINRVLGSESPLGTRDSDSHFLRAVYSGVDFLNIEAFGYWLDFESAAALSTETFGMRLWGQTDLANDVSLSYDGSYAQQSEHGSNPGDFDLDYYAIKGALTWGNFTGTAGYEVLSGDGIRGFSTPLATAHGLQGFADLFLSTPSEGVEDLYGIASVKFAPDVLEKPITLSVYYHDFEAENTSLDMGSEWDALLVVPLPSNFKVVAKYADYNGNGFAADRRKAWLALEFAL